MSTLAEVEAAAIELPALEQAPLIAVLSERLRRIALWENDPVRSIIGMIDNSDGPTDVARNDEEFLYGDDYPR